MYYEAVITGACECEKWLFEAFPLQSQHNMGTVISLQTGPGTIARFVVSQSLPHSHAESFELKSKLPALSIQT